MSDAGCSMLVAGAWGGPREMLWGGRWERGKFPNNYLFVIYAIQDIMLTLIFLKHFALPV